MKTIAIITKLGRRILAGKSAILILLFLLISVGVYSQDKDTKKTPPKDFTARVWLGSQVLPGYGQIVNRDYKKLPVFYGGMGSMLYLGINANKSYLHHLYAYNLASSLSPDKERLKIKMVEHRQRRNLYFVAAGAFYMASVVDALNVYNKGKHSPVNATIFSTLIPGLGQAYNKKYWKIPVIYGGLSTFYFIASWNNRGYKRFKTALKYNIDDDPNTIDEFNGQRTDTELRYYMNSYRRNRDLCILGFTVVYVLNILDANVDAHLYDWNVDDNLSFRVEPTVVNSEVALTGSSAPVFGLSCQLTF
ncbi:MAG: DUF5683 domain-containing protein [Bacteroidales bacterium]